MFCQIKYLRQAINVPDSAVWKTTKEPAQTALLQRLSSSQLLQCILQPASTTANILSQLLILKF